SSFTGRPLSHVEMNEQVAATVQRIGSLRGKRILEIGCGTGLLLLRLAGACKHYVGTDISARVLEQVRAAVAQRQWSHVELWEREADNFENIEAQTFDVVVLNSVVQYFPSMDYLVRVIRNACRILRPGGYIFLGDVRSLPLLRLLNTGIELERCGPNTTVAELHERVERRTDQEPELVIDPVFFEALQQQFEEITGASIQLKRGWELNELTCFRYDVCLQVNGSAESMESVEVFDWSTLSSVEGLREHLQQNAPSRLQVRGVPNARLQSRQRIFEQLDQVDPGAPLKSLNLNATFVGVEPEDFWALERDLDYEIQVYFGGPENPACYHVLCTRREQGRTKPTVWRSVHAKADTKPWSAYANNMQHSMAERDHELMLRQYLGRKLPEYMIPATFVWMDTLPLTATGKINRAALPEPDSSRLRLGEVYAPPETELQKQIATVWSEVLRLEKIGIDSTFFNIGGHSLLAMQVISRLNDSLKLEIPLRLMFEVPTIRRFAEAVGELQAAAKERSAPPIVPLRRHTASEEIDLERLSDEQVDALLSGLLTRDASASG
ncbi:MAG TPA: methyltransferase, partial [Pyrinomonadaceae bacterium]|nr:methyltransferase [Pyrinomonadaceae bacterium]